MAEFKKYVRTNTTDLEGALKAAMTPMEHFYDQEHDGLPFFWNSMCGGSYFGNAHHSTYSMSHIPGRWLNALLNAEQVLGIRANEAAVAQLAKWAYASVEKAGIGLPACIDLNTFEVIPETDLHNLREVMHAFYALVKYRSDSQALGLAKCVIRTVDTYFDYDKGYFDKERYEKETGGKVVEPICENYPFPLNFGRYIGPLVKLYKACGCEEALLQAIRLKDVCFRFLLKEDGSYDPEIFGYHTHSTTAMISSLAQLGEVLNDMEILARVKGFMENGLKEIALDFGWCIEFAQRDDMGGEINNTADLMETCLILAKAGFSEYFSKAEKMLRGHLLPAQLLDTCFIPEDLPDSFAYQIRRYSVGAFGFPAPWGHEYEPGHEISFNWDIVGGAAGGLCEALRSRADNRKEMYSVDLLFDFADDVLEVKSPYTNRGKMILRLKKECPGLRVRIPEHVCAQEIQCNGCNAYRSGHYLYLTQLTETEVTIYFPFETVMQSYSFRNHTFQVKWWGESIVGMSSAGKRLCFFPDIGETI